MYSISESMVIDSGDPGSVMGVAGAISGAVVLFSTLRAFWHDSSDAPDAFLFLDCEDVVAEVAEHPSLIEARP